MNYKTVNILNGDALLYHLNDLNGQTIIMREVMMEGPVEGNTLLEVLNNRVEFFGDYFETKKEVYQEKSISELTKMNNLDNESEINLWFEFDLFCQVNFWFCVNYISQAQADSTLFLVSPGHDNWNGFGYMSKDALLKAQADKQMLSAYHVASIRKLWKAYQASDFELMKLISEDLTSLIPPIKEVIKAHIERFPMKSEDQGRPQACINRLYNEEGLKDFGVLFKKFSSEQGIYGYGDLQVRKIMEVMGLSTD